MPNVNFIHHPHAINESCQRRLGANADQVCSLYYDDPTFRALWDDYVVCQLGLQHWSNSTTAQAGPRQLEYVQTIYELEQEIRRHLEKSWDVVQDLMGRAIFGNASEILSELREFHGMHGREVYLAPMFPLIEMAWLGQTPNVETRQFVTTCGQFICKRMEQLSGGLEVLSNTQLARFLKHHMECPVEPTQLRRLADLGLAYLRCHSNKRLVAAREKALWQCSYRIASQNLQHAPNSDQWSRLLDFLPESIDWRNFQSLVKTDVSELMTALQHAWQQN